VLSNLFPPCTAGINKRLCELKNIVDLHLLALLTISLFLSLKNLKLIIGGIKIFLHDTLACFYQINHEQLCLKVIKKTCV